jgi:hypothetical protein
MSVVIFESLLSVSDESIDAAANVLAQARSMREKPGGVAGARSYVRAANSILRFSPELAQVSGLQTETGGYGNVTAHDVVDDGRAFAGVWHVGNIKDNQDRFKGLSNGLIRDLTASPDGRDHLVLGERYGDNQYVMTAAVLVFDGQYTGGDLKREHADLVISVPGDGRLTVASLSNYIIQARTNGDVGS